MLQLRPDQSALLSRVRDSLTHARSSLMVAPTGFGKTVCFSWMAQRVVHRKKRVVILVHRDELIDQVAETLRRFGVPCTYVAAGRRYRHEIPVVVASVFTLKNRLHIVHAPDLVVVDEAHHAIAASSWGKVIAAWPQAKVVGVTATPQRLAGEGLGELFEDMVVGPSTADLIDAGSLSPYEYYCPPTVDLTNVRTRMGDYAVIDLEKAMNQAGVTGNAVEHYRDLAHGKRAVVFCVSLKHAAAVRDQFRSAGYRAEQIDGTMEKVDRRALVQRFSAGQVQVLVSCDVVSEGFDLPAIEVAILLRPTQSVSLYLQQVGRALRTFPGKSHALILDHAGNVNRHGLPDEVREWTLDAKKRKKSNKDKAPSVRLCPTCFAALPSGTTNCRCGHVFVPQPREVAENDGKLVKVTPEMRAELARRRKDEQSKAKTLEDLVALGKARGYKFPREWALKLHAARTNRKPNYARH